MDQKENQPLELEELDLALPDDLSAGGDFSSGSSIDDLDLDLPELTDEDGDSMGSPSYKADRDLPDGDLPEADLPETAALPETTDALDEEPIALSEEELERIMGSSDAGSLSDDFADASEEPLASQSDADLDLGDSGSDVPDLDLAMDMETDLSSPESFGSGAEAPLPEMDMDFADMHTDLEDEDEGPVALSEEELGSIMGDVSEQLDAPEHLHAEMPDADFDDMGEMPDMGADQEPAAMAAGDPEDEENITLSDEELNNILLDASDLEPAGRGPEPAEAPRLSEMGLDDEDEPIALTAEELGNIISDVSEVADGEESPDAMDLPAVGILDEEDEGPLALSDDELNSILEDVHEEAADAPMAAGPDRNLIVLDEYEDQEKAEEIRGRDAAIGRVAASSGVDKTELKKMIGYLDQLFDKLPEETIREFSSSEYFDLYKRIMQDLDLS